jgi:hypothetical protein
VGPGSKGQPSRIRLRVGAGTRTCRHACRTRVGRIKSQAAHRQREPLEGTQRSRKPPCRAALCGCAHRTHRAAVAAVPAAAERERRFGINRQRQQGQQCREQQSGGQDGGVPTAHCGPREPCRPALLDAAWPDQAHGAARSAPGARNEQGSRAATARMEDRKARTLMSHTTDKFCSTNFALDNSRRLCS